MATNSQYEDTIQKVYIAYYGRAADSGGLAFWSNKLAESDGDLEAIIGNFSSAQEFTDRFGALDNGQLVDNIYQQQFGRAPDAGGREWYVGHLNAGTKELSTITLDVLNGASGDDVTIVENKIAAAIEFTNNYAAQNFDYAGTEAANAVKTLFDGITIDGNAGLDSVMDFLDSQPTSGTDGDASNDLSSPTALGMVLFGESEPQEQSVGADGDTKDYFSFSPGDTMSGTLKLTNMSADLDLYLYNAAGEQLSTSESNGDETITYEFDGTKEYIVGVEPFEGAISGYQLDFASGTSTPTDSSDASNDPSSPTALGTVLFGESEPQTQSVGAGGDTADYFSFSPGDTFESTLTLTGMGADLDIALFDVDGNQLAGSDEAGSVDEFITYEFEGGVVYLVGVMPADGAVSDYSLNFG